jgi:hypothetical protein
MAAFARRRDVLGGALLGAAIVMKVAPGLLLVVLLARRQWRQAALVGGWMAAYTLLGLVVLGPAPLVAFFGYQLPRIASGAAFAFQLGRPGLLAESFAAYVLPLKLRAFGVPGMTLGVASTVGKAYGAALVAVAVVAARRGTGSRLDDAQRTLALLGLAGLASPIAPYPYAVAGTVWLLTLLAADVRGARDGVLLLAAWVYFAVTLFALDVPPLHELDMLVGPFVTIAFLGWVALRSNAPRLEGDVTHAHPSPTNAAA